jgi:hypothetical protein
MIEEWLEAPGDWVRMDGCEDLDAITVESILNEAALFASDVLLPINLPGDIEGCQFDNGSVRTPTGYRHRPSRNGGGWTTCVYQGCDF